MQQRGQHGCVGKHGEAPWPALEAAVQNLEKMLPAIAPEAFHAFNPAAGLGYEEPEGLQREGSWRAVDVVELREILRGTGVFYQNISSSSSSSSSWRFEKADWMHAVSALIVGFRTPTRQFPLFKSHSFVQILLTRA